MRWIVMRINRSGTTSPSPQPITRTWPADLMVLDRAAPSPAQTYGEYNA
jgi:hypothetical protein